MIAEFGQVIQEAVTLMDSLPWYFQTTIVFTFFLILVMLVIGISGGFT
jgi:hypothetical protein